MDNRNKGSKSRFISPFEEEEEEIRSYGVSWGEVVVVLVVGFFSSSSSSSFFPFADVISPLLLWRFFIFTFSNKKLSPTTMFTSSSSQLQQRIPPPPPPPPPPLPLPSSNKSQLLSISQEVSSVILPCLGPSGFFHLNCYSPSKGEGPLFLKKGDDIISRIETLQRHPFGSIIQKLASSQYSTVGDGVITSVLLVTEFLTRILSAMEGGGPSKKNYHKSVFINPLSCCEALLHKILPCIHTELQIASISLQDSTFHLQQQLERVFYSACNTKIDDGELTRCLSEAFSRAIISVTQDSRYKRSKQQTFDLSHLGLILQCECAPVITTARALSFQGVVFAQDDEGFDLKLV